MRRIFIVPTMMLMACPVALARPVVLDNSGGKASSVTYTLVRPGDYQNFLKNWDDAKEPRQFALIQTPAQYGQLFSPAAIMRGNRPFAPDPGIYKAEQIVVVGRVVAASGDLDKLFTVDRVTETDGELHVYYNFHTPRPDARAYRVKNYLGLRVRKSQPKKVVFFENGIRVGELKVAEGQWRLP